MSVTETHEQKGTMIVDVYVPGHAPRETTALFTRTRKKLLESVSRCFICNRTAQESGGPLEAHHHPIERSFAEMMDWGVDSAIRRDYPDFDWVNFNESDPYKFVDDMTINGMILCKLHHTGKDAGIHELPYPLWIAQKYGKEGYQFSPTQILHYGHEIAD